MKGVIKLVKVYVNAGNAERSLRELKRRMQRENIFRYLKNRRFYEPPSEVKRRKREESERRRKKLERKRNMEY